MSEKRFTLAYEKGNWWAVRDGDITLWKEEVVSLLNELYNENRQLKKTNNKCIVDYNGLNTEYQWVKEENNKLKSILEEMKDKNEEICLMDGRIIKLKKVLKK